MIQKRVLWILALLISFQLQAQQKLWTFQQCLDTALKNNIALNQTRLANELDKISLEQAKAGRIPSLSGSVSESFFLGRNIDPTTNQFVEQTYHSTNVGLSSGYNIFNGFQNNNTIKQNRLIVEAGKSDIEKSKDDVMLNITTAYLQVLYSYEILATAKVQAASTAAQVDMTQKMVNAGKVPESNLLQIKSQFATDNLSVVTAQNQLDIARVTLEQLMVIPVADSFDIVRPEIVEPVIVPMTNDEIYRQSLDIRPEIKSASLQTTSSQMAVKVAKGARYPRLNLSLGLNSNYASSRKQGSAVNPENYPFFDQIWNNLGQTMGLNLSIPIYSNRQIKSNIDRANINAQTAYLTEQNTRNQLRMTIEQTMTDLKASLKKYEATKEQLAATEDSYKNSERKFNVGLMNSIDFLVEKNNYIKAQSTLIQTKYDYIFKSKILDFYLGRQISF